MKETFYLKNELGIQKLLTHVNMLSNKNLAFYKNTFYFFNKQHPPFPGSYLTYHPKDNFFRFLTKTNVKDMPIIDWKSYTYGVPALLKEKNGTFLYFTEEPYIIIVAEADWILNKDIQDRAQIFLEYMDNHVPEEREIWKLNLIANTPNVAKPLF